MGLGRRMTLKEYHDEGRDFHLIEASLLNRYYLISPIISSKPLNLPLQHEQPRDSQQLANVVYLLSQYFMRICNSAVVVLYFVRLQYPVLPGDFPDRRSLYYETWLDVVLGPVIQALFNSVPNSITFFISCYSDLPASLLRLV